MIKAFTFGFSAFFTIASSICFTVSASAQTPPAAALFGRLMAQRMTELAKEPAIVQRTHGKTGMELFQAAGDSALYFADDSTLRDLGKLFAESGARAEPERCARLYTGGADDFPDAFTNMLVVADSTLLDSWSFFMKRLTRAGILRPPLGRVATPTEITNTIRTLVQREPPADRERFRRGAAKTGTPAEICYFTVTLYGQFASLPPAQGGPVIRAMMRGVQPKLP